jgi:hypothetical protein
MVVGNGQPEASDFRPGAIPITADYTPNVYNNAWTFVTKAPPFTLRDVSSMLVDFRIRWGLWMIKGPMLCKSKFFVKCDDPVVKEFLINTVTRFWRTSAMRAMKAFEWGYSCSEALYVVKKDQIQFNYLKDIHSVDAKALTRNGFICGSRVSRIPKRGISNNGKVDIFGPRKFWHVHNREGNPFYGQSRLFGSYLPWIELWGDGGYRDSRRLFYHKYAYDGGGIYVPEGSTNVGNDGSGRPRSVSNVELGRNVVEKMKAGGTMTLPGVTDENGKRKWEKIPVEVRPTPSGIMEYGETLKDEMWEGLGIPPEIGRAQGTGAYAGRIVPLIGFYSTLQELIYWLISDADEQIFRPLVSFNFGPDVEYEIIPFSILDEAMREDDGGTDGLPDDGGNPMENLQEPPKLKDPNAGSSLGQYTDADPKRLYRSLLASYKFEPTPMVF